MTDLVPLEQRGLVPIRQFGKLPVYNIKQLQRQGLFWLIYGPGGLGKTSLALTAMDSVYGKPLCLVEIDRGGSVGSHRDCDAILIKTYRDFRDFMSELQHGSEWLTIVVDPLTDLMDMCFEEKAALIHSADPRQHYAAMTAEMVKHIKTLRDLSMNSGVNVILTCWEDDFTDEVTKTRRNGLKLNPALRDRVQGLVTTIGYLTLAGDDKTRVLQLAPSKRYATKFRRSDDDVAQQIPFNIPQPSMAPILDTLIGGKPFKLTPQQQALLKRQPTDHDTQTSSTATNTQAQE